MSTAVEIEHPILDGDPSKGERGLNHQQKAATLTSLRQNTLIIAGAGAGKTATATRRTAFLLADKRDVPDLPPNLSPEGESPGSILMITFTNKAGAEMRERSAALVGEHLAKKLWIGTFHSICVKLLRMFPDDAGLDTNKFTILDPDDQKAILKEIVVDEIAGAVDGGAVTPPAGLKGDALAMWLVAELLDKKKKVKVDTKILAAITAQISDWKNRLMTPSMAELENPEDDMRDTIRVYRRYQDRLARDQQLDFDDLIMKTVQGLNQPDSEMTRYCHQRFKWIMVDEFQDTNEAQYQLVKSLASHFCNVTVVGDDKQSIYGWRGAEVKNVRRFVREFNASLQILTYNYRCQGNIVAAANALIANNPDQIKMEAEAVRGQGQPLKLHVASTADDEAEFIAGEIQNLVEFNGYQFKDVAILVRNWNLTAALERVFVRWGVPYDIINGTKFFERKLIKDTIAGLTLIMNPDASAPARRVAGLTPGVGKTSLDSIAELSEQVNRSFLRTMPAWVAQAKAGAGKNGILRFMSLWSNMWKQFPVPEEAKITEVLNAVWRIMEIGYVSPDGKFIDLENTIKYAKSKKDKVEGDPLEDERNNLMEFWGIAKRFEEQATGNTLPDFLENVSLVSQADAGEGGNSVGIMTLHAAKGLEYPVVFMPAFEENIFPSGRDKGTPEQMEEARRLAYVGLTRAKDELYLTRARQRPFYNDTMYNPESRFLNEIPGNLITEL